MDLSFTHKLEEFAQTKPDVVAIRRGTMKVTYAKLLHKVREAALILQQNGVVADSTVALSISDELENLVISLALLGLGSWHITAATHESHATRQQLADRVTATLQITDVPDCKIDGLQSFLWFGRQGGATPSRLLLPNGGGAFYSTSGTTGRMSILKFSEAEMILQAMRNYNKAGEKFAKVASCEFGHVKRNRLFALWLGAENILLPHDSRPLSTRIEKSGAEVVDLSRMQFVSLLSTPKSTISKEIALRSEGSGMPLDLRKKIRNQLSDNFHVRYASTETGLISIAGPDEHNIEGGVGKPWTDVQIQLVDDCGDEVANGDIGEIKIKTPGMASSYFEDPEKTKQRFHNGWFYLGIWVDLPKAGNLLSLGERMTLSI